MLAFPDCVPYLPPPLTVKQLADMLGMTEDEYKRQVLHSHPGPLDPDNPGHDIRAKIPF